MMTRFLWVRFMTDVFEWVRRLFNVKKKCLTARFTRNATVKTFYSDQGNVGDVSSKSCVTSRLMIDLKSS